MYVYEIRSEFIALSAFQICNFNVEDDEKSSLIIFLIFESKEEQFSVSIVHCVCICLLIAEHLNVR